ncbi:hypothetical protein CROQUDRAFT_717360 [Cronartium quercuum f. sp. fusiforme G11]|uniref:Uncharacterized protein n=1 Tax=Cronartium quercuum f. sp. fusiforme G11 TaxID=708437 RepID=A0A9P6NAN3_9BASI|nr:hypothetical protein CROQUDRAFT_717360 [Cronartium quercuum f. sp. fusiforme G11]
MSSGSSTIKLLSVLVTMFLPLLTQAIEFQCSIPEGPGWEDGGEIKEPFTSYFSLMLAALFELFFPKDHVLRDVTVYHLETLTKDLSIFAARVALLYQEYGCEFDLNVEVKNRKIQNLFIQRQVIQKDPEDPLLSKFFENVQKSYLSFMDGLAKLQSSSVIIYP